MRTPLPLSLGLLALTLSLGACSGMTTREKNTAAGAAVGGVIGNQIGK
jgi:osmotically inducible lipoprotein OsmB